MAGKLAAANDEGNLRKIRKVRRKADGTNQNTIPNSFTNISMVRFFCIVYFQMSFRRFLSEFFAKIRPFKSLF